MSDTPTATEALFEVLEGEPWPLRVHVSGTGYVARALPLVASVGDVVVQQIRTWADESGFTGVLRELPADGDVLRIGWADDELVATPVVFQGGGNV
jgi:hypothetical protein